MENTIEILVGLFGIPIIQAIKHKLGISGLLAQWLALAIGLVLAAGLMFFQGDMALIFSSPDEFAETLSRVFVAGFLGYRLLVERGA